MNILKGACRLNQIGCDKRNWKCVNSGARLPGQFMFYVVESRDWNLLVLVSFQSVSKALFDLQVKTV